MDRSGHGTVATTLADLSPEALAGVMAAEHAYYHSTNPGEFAIGLLRSLQAMPAHGMPVNLYRHSLQTATRCLADGEDEELVVVALLHDVGEAFSPSNHGAVSAEVLRPFVSAENAWLLQQHATFQEYYFAGKLGLNSQGREAHRGSPHFEATLRFCEQWDQVSFDPSFVEQPLEIFEPMVRRIFSRHPSR